MVDCAQPLVSFRRMGDPACLTDGPLQAFARLASGANGDIISLNSRSNENELGSNLVFGAWNTWNMLEHLDSSQVSQPCSKAVSTWGHLHRSLFAPCHHPAGQFGGIAH